MDTVLIVEDEVHLCEEIAHILREAGWTTVLTHSSEEAAQVLASRPIDVMLLDWSLPGMSGVDFCKQLRREGNQIAIIFLTGRNGIDDIAQGLETGGDDYITKPFDVRELVARLRAVRRRPVSLRRESIIVRGVQFFPSVRAARMGSTEVQLTFMESSILEFFMRNPDTFFSAAQIFEQVWPADSNASSDETVRVHMRLLRTKLAQLGEEKLIITVRGSGYILRDKTYMNIEKPQ
jgi:DNA-binding response OmpR family regulator